MSNEIRCLFRDVTEHDMDMLFLEEFVCSEAFLRIFTEEIGIRDSQVVSVQSSKTDIVLGESDMTVVIEADGDLVGLLIENKIDANAMPEQAGRYMQRGIEGISEGEYKRFFIFIIAPENYLSVNEEAKKYPHKTSYERILSYFEKLDDKRSVFKIQQIRQAIDKQKKGYQVQRDNAVTDFWRKYSEFQKEKYPDVLLIYNNEVKGANATWPRFRTSFDKLYMYHKTESGYVDLTFENCADRMVNVDNLLADAVGDYAKEGYSINKTTKSAAIRLNVPKLNLHQPFEEQIDKVDAGLKAVENMSNLVRMLSFQGLIDLLGSRL